MGYRFLAGGVLFLFFQNFSIAGQRLRDVEIPEIRPTQYSAGYVEVGKRSKKLARLGRDELELRKIKKAGIAVLGPEDTVFIVDRHHFAAALLRIGESDMPVLIKKDYSHLSWDAFWKKMRKKNWVYLFDENGKPLPGPHALPLKISDLRDDPYRSLAWFVRKKLGLKKKKAYFEFRIANELREKIDPSLLRHHFKSKEYKQAIDEGCRIIEASRCRRWLEQKE